ncbi:MAG: HAD-IA family hydrolase [Eubacteriales bacterium]|nr:HAD-IA family hydrolase [Eubacteriales bacterium]
MIRTIIFDIDETLYIYTPLHRITLKILDDYCVEHLGFEPGEFAAAWPRVYKEITAELGFGNSCIHDILLRSQIILEQKGINPLPHARTLYYLYWDNIISRMVPCDGIHQFLQKARQSGIRLGLGTDMMTEIQYRKLEKLELLDAFDFIVTSEEAGYEKPQEGFFRKVLEKTKCDVEECVMIGDNWDKDIVGAFGVGMPAIWFRPDVDPESCDSEHRKILVRSYEELTRKLL